MLTLHNISAITLEMNEGCFDTLRASSDMNRGGQFQLIKFLDDALDVGIRVYLKDASTGATCHVFRKNGRYVSI